MISFDKQARCGENTFSRNAHLRGDVAQLGEHHGRNVGVVGSNPIISTTEVNRPGITPGLICVLGFPPWRGRARCDASLLFGSAPYRVSCAFLYLMLSEALLDLSKAALTRDETLPMGSAAEAVGSSRSNALALCARPSVSRNCSFREACFIRNDGWRE